MSVSWQKLLAHRMRRRQALTTSACAALGAALIAGCGGSEDSATTQPKVLFDNDFSDGIQGWSGLRTIGTNYYPSLIPASLSGPYSMVLDCTDDGSTAARPVAACKRVYAHEGKIGWQARVAWNYTNSVNDLVYLRLILDWQRGDSIRRWMELRYQHFDESASAVVGKWYVNHGSNAGKYSEIAEMSGYVLGPNQIYKYDFHDIEIILDTANLKWISLKVDSEAAIDLSSLVIDDTIPIEADFANGANFLFWIQDRTQLATADPYLVVDYTKAQVLSR